MSISADFAQWVKHNQIAGVDGNDNEAFYVPDTKLREYWDRTRITRVLSAQNTPHIVSEITNSYLHIFSTLVYITTLHLPALSYLEEFRSQAIDDGNLPYLNQTIFPDSPEARQVFEQFSKYQFLFNYVTFDRKPHRRNLDARAVLPLTLRGQLSGGRGDSAVVKVYEAHPASKLKEVRRMTLPHSLAFTKK